MFSAPKIIFGRTVGVGSGFHVLRARNHFHRYRGRQVPFSCFARPDSFSAVQRASSPVFMFFGPELIFGGTVGVGSRFHVLRSVTRFRRYRVRLDLFSCFERPDSISTVPRASVPFSCFALPDSFSAVQRVSGLMFSAPGLVFGGIKAVGSRFRVLCSRNCFRRYRRRRNPFSCLARPDSFSAVPTASHPVFMFSAPRHVFGGTEGVGSRFHVLRSRKNFHRHRGRWVPFSSFARPASFSLMLRALGFVFLFSAPEIIFGGTVGVGSCFQVLLARNHVRRYRGRWFLFSCFARPESFSAVPMASCAVFLFCAPELAFGGTMGVGSRFHVLRSVTHFRRCRERLVPFSCFALPDSFLTVPRASGPVFMYCAPGLNFGGIEGVRHHV
jgi:hypothetical protein